MSRLELNPTLICKTLSKSYASLASTTTVLDNFSFQLNQGEIGMLLGPSGCGKTTLLMIVGGILIPDKGTCIICDTDLFALSLKEKVLFRGSYISFLFQHLHLFPALSALENIALPLLIDGVQPAIAYKKAKELMIRLGLEIHIHSKLDILSGGQKQRIAMGRALIRGSRLILCDEPTSNLDQDSAQLIFSVIQEYAQIEKCTFLICTHDHRITPYASKIVEFKGLADHRILDQKEYT